ncbi:efflux RND transporter permease subunit [Trinickia diaoshuihuensis]|uniref:efflux RND transporter permease subunit n=1 Tax=Trinickia diaoshuihuensis TaxID=2292265 RepID=UPI000E240C3A|nr:efflux RND transporter permease subunit [Trinickia diaoshuihuensis]
MRFARYFVTRPIGTALLALALAVAGFMSFRALPAAPLPEVEFPTISVRAALPGADPETMANAVATPLERRLGHIAGVSEMTSVSEVGFTRIVLQFALDRDIDGAARDVQAAIDAAKSDLPKDMPQNPLYYKSNPADAPIMVLSLTSARASPTEMFDVASTVLQQRLLRTPGVGEVGVGGGALPAVRVELDPDQLTQHGIALADMRQFLLDAAPARALGSVVIGTRQYTIDGNDNLLRAKQFAQLYFRTQNGSVVRLSDLARVHDSVEDVRNSGIANGKSAVLLIVYKQPGANIIDTVAAIKAQLPFLKASIPADIDISLIGDRTPAIHASLADIEFTLALSIGLVMLVTMAFFRDWRSAIVPSIALPLALLGTFAVMYVVGYSLNILSLMALAISTGFVVDDAIVVVENVMRHVEQGKTPFEAAIHGTAEVSFTIFSITLSLLAAFIPLLLMGGIVGRLFREFSVSMSVAVALSMLLSLTLTPMMCRLFIRGRSDAGHGPARAGPLIRFYDRSLSWALDHRGFVLAVALGTTAATAALFAFIPKGFFPLEDTGRIGGVLYVSQASSFSDVHQKLQQVIEEIRRDPDVANALGYAGTGLVPNSATVFMYLKPEQARHATSDEVIARVLKRSTSIPDLHLYLQPAQDLVLGGRRTAAQYQYTFSAENLDELNRWSPALIRAVRHTPGVMQVNSNAAMGGRQSFLQINRQLAARYGTDVSRIDETLYDAFGQRRLDVLYEPGNEYRLVMEADPLRWSGKDALARLRIPADCLACEAPRGAHDERSEPASASLAALSAFGTVRQGHTPLLINHTGQFPSETISFNLSPGTSLGDATRAITASIAKLGLPSGISGSFTGSAQAFQQSLKAEPLLIAVALAAVYLILGILYEDLIHPLTILSSLPPAGLGALLTLSALHIELSVMALIGLILLIGIVKKNAIMLVDFALTLQRERGHDPRSAIHEACLVRARPILMTTLAALLGALPLVVGTGYGAEFRKPLGLTIVGGLVLSQLVTLYTTPVVFLMLARIRKAGHSPQAATGSPPGIEER